MAEFASEVRMHKVDYLCDQCNEPLGHMNIVKDGQFLHECPRCKTIFFLEKKYPVLTYKPFDIRR